MQPKRGNAATSTHYFAVVQSLLDGITHRGDFECRDTNGLQCTFRTRYGIFSTDEMEFL
jgi:hypothetical protein